MNLLYSLQLDLTMEITWKQLSFEQLSNVDLYKILQLRAAVFIIEQNCIYQDLDDKDFKSHHVCAYSGNDLVAYTRVLPAGLSYEEVSIGRVVTSVKARGKGIGKLLMEKSIETAYALFGNVDIKISAQFYLLKFYQSLGFVEQGEVYLEDNIEHIQMVKLA
ncbi:GNAT family N-acetyltransferase [Polluticaenibacter yanchengensis]|uniref:GNAT family N-acetyltransferase n=1 Tax=Polluticaenibacter yanchengensis TaxID=3014562 RepID=A0ABT4UPP9_9BACT|nr:GNAT family N-acetyltransferase [Chitinophagaceae bacterium LY-5]